MSAVFGVVGDIGGTNCRFALVRHGETVLTAPTKYQNADYDDVYGALKAYLENEAEGHEVSWAVIAVAGPVEGDSVALTNRAWSISGPEITRRLGVKNVRLVNDFAALAAAAPYFVEHDLKPLGGAAPRAMAGVTTTAMIGPGTGLGVGGLVRRGETALVLTTEGGHTDFAPLDDVEREIERLLRTQFERVSYERLLCGEGLVNIHSAISVIEGASAERFAPQEITKRAIARSDARCVRTLDVFTRILGAFSGDVVLTLGARGGLYVAGGIISVILPVFDQAAFRARFEAKGRFRGYMEETPAWIVAHAFPALVGAAALARDLINPVKSASGSGAGANS